MAISGTSVSVELRSGRLATEEISGPVRVLFVGERPSPLAARRNWRWEDGRLCAGTLLRVVRAAGLDPEQFRFVNLWVTPGLGPTREAPHLEPVIQAHRQGSTIIALGRLVERTLRRAQVPHRYMVHPAARGRIREQDTYIAHVRAVLGSSGQQSRL